MRPDLISGLQKHANTHENEPQQRSHTRFREAKAGVLEAQTRVHAGKYALDCAEGGRRGGEGWEKMMGREEEPDEFANRTACLGSPAGFGSRVGA
ncbi:hypothetical protein Agabi119p4_5853 [Agaricus bisporus var. burnettii]|uniref:Uncharacterized protein n=1 Tax=Agaricus bisporus var. burnettii TaxID=192524 RepID=A0A8H7F2C5_AGABI|nr:hypothetical protein Agabi119p4_5853 [Agaricus bisporus var. burnettii]